MKDKHLFTDEHGQQWLAVRWPSFAKLQMGDNGLPARDHEILRLAEELEKAEEVVASTERRAEAEANKLKIENEILSADRAGLLRDRDRLLMENRTLRREIEARKRQQDEAAVAFREAVAALGAEHSVGSGKGYEKGWTAALSLVSVPVARFARALAAGAIPPLAEEAPDAGKDS